MKRLSILLAGMAASIAFAADDPSIKGQLRADIHQAMNTHVEGNEINGQYVLYDALRGKMLRMKLDNLHEGIVSKGDFYVSCADFIDEAGNTYDIDFMVAGDQKDLSVYQAIVHEDNFGKRQYHLED